MKEVFLRGAFSENHSLYLFGGIGGTDADKTGYYLENGAFFQRKKRGTHRLVYRRHPYYRYSSNIYFRFLRSRLFCFLKTFFKE